MFLVSILHILTHRMGGGKALKILSLPRIHSLLVMSYDHNVGFLVSNLLPLVSVTTLLL